MFVNEPPENEIWNYQQIELGFNYRMTDIHAALGLSQLQKLKTFVEKRNKIALIYNEALKNLPLQLPTSFSNRLSSFHLYVIRLQKTNHIKKKKDIFRDFHKNGVLVNLHYIPVYRQPFYKKLGFNIGYCEEAEKYFQQAISIPIHPGLTAYEQSYTIETTEKILATH